MESILTFRLLIYSYIKIVDTTCPWIFHMSWQKTADCACIRKYQISKKKFVNDDNKTKISVCSCVILSNSSSRAIISYGIDVGSSDSSNQISIQKDLHCNCVQ